MNEKELFDELQYEAYLDWKRDMEINRKIELEYLKEQEDMLREAEAIAYYNYITGSDIDTYIKGYKP
jgi:hypothetical protein